MRSRGTSFDYTVWAQLKHGGGAHICQAAGTFLSEDLVQALDFDNKASSMWNTNFFSDCQ